jgi:hypothetical protein
MEYSINTNNDGFSAFICTIFAIIGLISKWMPYVEGLSHWTLFFVQFSAATISIVVGLHTIKGWFKSKRKTK